MILGLAKPWVWVQPKTTQELIQRLLEAREYMVHERERENLCSVAALELQALLGELQTAVNECCNDYWNHGHGARVEAKYGIAMKAEEEA